MDVLIFSGKEREKIVEYFGCKIEDLTYEEFEKKLKELRAKYHPDKFEKYVDAVVRELSTEKYKEIEQLSEKLKKYISSKRKNNSYEETLYDNNVVFAYDKLKIEIITKEKDLKYYLFGTHYRWLERGDKYKIAGTNASIVIDQNYNNISIGFFESIKMYLTFSETDSLEIIFLWLFEKISGFASYMLIEGRKVNIDYNEMLSAVKQKTMKRIGDHPKPS
jgi:hypothetical protein